MISLPANVRVWLATGHTRYAQRHFQFGPDRPEDARAIPMAGICSCSENGAAT